MLHWPVTRLLELLPILLGKSCCTADCLKFMMFCNDTVNGGLKSFPGKSLSLERRFPERLFSQNVTQEVPVTVS